MDGRGRNGMITLSTRRLDKAEVLRWKACETALIICDMWDRHTCKSAERRVAEMAPRIDAFAKPLREKGVLIIHAPSAVMTFYEGTPERAAAKAAPFTPAPMAIDWQEPDPAREGPMPVDDDDWCDDTPKCPIKEIEEKGAWPWTRQISTIGIRPGDAVSDDGQEIYNLLQQRGIDNVIMTGVHLNRCVLGRPYGIRQLIKLGKNVVLVRDLTDGLYDPRQRPYVSRAQGMELLVRHVEKFWCPSALRGDISWTE